MKGNLNLSSREIVSIFQLCIQCSNTIHLPHFSTSSSVSCVFITWKRLIFSAETSSIYLSFCICYFPVPQCKLGLFVCCLQFTWFGDLLCNKKMKNPFCYGRLEKADVSRSWICFNFQTQFTQLCVYILHKKI